VPADIQRTVLVASHEPHLWVALRDRLDPTYALVRFSTPQDLAQTWSSLLPWPWVVVGDCSTLAESTVRLLNDAPVAIHWLGSPPAGLRTTPAADWRAVCNALKHSLAVNVGSLQLAPVRGVNTPSGRLDRVEVLENLLAAYPRPLPAGAVSTERTTRINRLLAQGALPWKVIRRRGQLYLKNHQEVTAIGSAR